MNLHHKNVCHSKKKKKLEQKKKNVKLNLDKNKFALV